MRKSERDELYVEKYYTGKLCKLQNETKMEKWNRDTLVEYNFSSGEVLFIVKVLRVDSGHIEMMFLTRNSLYTTHTTCEIDDQPYPPREYMKKNFRLV